MGILEILPQGLVTLLWWLMLFLAASFVVLLLAVLVGYLLGAFPSAYIAARIVKGRDIRQVGGGNMGTLNTLREVGFVPGLLVFSTDVAKGALAILAAKWLGVNEIIIFIRHRII